MRYTRANLAAVREMLGSTESAITRANLTSRLDGLEEELRRAEAQVACLAEATVLFDGTPVRARLGINASFGGEGIQRVQELVVTLTADRASGVGERGPLPAVPRLFITDVEVGSFGFQLTELGDPGLFNTPSPLKTSLDEATRLLSAAADSDEALVSALATRSPRVLQELRELLALIDKAGATLSIDTDRARSQLDTPDRVRAARERADAATLTEDEESLAGVLCGILQDRRRFELRLDRGEMVSGRLHESLDAAGLVGRFNQRVGARLQRRTAARGGRSRTAWVILAVDGEASGAALGG